MHSGRPGRNDTKPALKINPARQTLPAESKNIFSASSGTGTITWAFVKNPSGGTIPFTYPTSIVYRAGTVSSRIDVLEAWDREDRLGRAYVNVIGSNEIATAGKATSWRTQERGDPLWPTTDYLADLAFNTLLYRGYRKTNIQYLNPVTNQDVDGNGRRTVTLTLRQPWLMWLRRSRTGQPKRIDCLCTWWIRRRLLGRGLFPAQRNGEPDSDEPGKWLDNLQNAYSTKVTVLIDCCYAGSFLDNSPTPARRNDRMRHVGLMIPRIFWPEAWSAFQMHFGAVMRGDDVEDARLAASNAMAGDEW